MCGALLPLVTRCTVPRVLRAAGPRPSPPPWQPCLQAFPASRSQARPEGPACCPVCPPPVCTLVPCTLAVRPPRAQCERWVTAPPGGSTAFFRGPSRVLSRFLFHVIGGRPLRPLCGWHGEVARGWRGRVVASVASPPGTQGACICRACFSASESSVAVLDAPEACVLVEVSVCPSHPRHSDFAISALWQSHRRGAFLALLAQGRLSPRLATWWCPTPRGDRLVGVSGTAS